MYINILLYTGLSQTSLVLWWYSRIVCHGGKHRSVLFNRWFFGAARRERCCSVFEQFCNAKWNVITLRRPVWTCCGKRNTLTGLSHLSWTGVGFCMKQGLTAGTSNSTELLCNTCSVEALLYFINSLRKLIATLANSTTHCRQTLSYMVTNLCLSAGVHNFRRSSS